MQPSQMLSTQGGRWVRDAARDLLGFPHTAHMEWACSPRQLHLQNGNMLHIVMGLKQLSTGTALGMAPGAQCWLSLLFTYTLDVQKALEGTAGAVTPGEACK
jgi:hypothetical protein